MSILTSILADLLQAAPDLRPQLYFKSSLTALSHAMEDQVLAGLEHPLVIASFQRERFYRQEAHRYRRIAARTPQVYVLAAPETDFKSCSDVYESVAFEPTDGLSKEWHLVVLSPHSSTCLICREKFAPAPENIAGSEMDPSRRFEGIWTFDRKVASIAAELLLNRILAYRPELADKIQQAKNVYGLTHLSQPTALGAVSKKKGTKQGKKQISSQNLTLTNQDAHNLNADPFVQRLVTYLQAGQYKLIKAYRSIASQEQKERLVNSITDAIRRSLNPDEIMQVAVQELGLTIHTSRCLIYYCKATDSNATITHEYLNLADRPEIPNVSLLGQIWTLKNNPLFEEILQRRSPVYVTDTYTDPRLSNSPIQALVQQLAIRSWLMVPVLYQDRLLGMVELHDSSPNQHHWKQYELELVEAIATQIGVALIQAEAYANLEDLNQQLEALDRTRANLVAITGHELRTPLSTIQVCLESLATEPDMSLELRQVMLNTALADTERMRKLVQDFLTLSRLESGRVEWHPESLSLNECIDVALSSIHARNLNNSLPEINSLISPALPFVRADGEWLVEVLVKLLDNACKFTPAQGNITIKADSNSNLLKVTVRDTGRGIEPNRLETVFDRFYQEEGSLRRTTGGTGLGLAICRQIVNNWGGEIWAESEGKDQGSAFHFTIPMIGSRSEPRRSGNTNKG